MNAQEACESLARLNHFPTKPIAVAAIMETIENNVTPDLMEDFVEAICARYDAWPGPATFLAECRASRKVKSQEWSQVDQWKKELEEEKRKPS